MQSAAGRGPGAALGVIAVVVVAIATYLAYRFAERERGMKSRGILMARGVTIEHVSFGYGATPVLDDISLDVARGRVLRLPRAVGLGQDHAAAADRRLRHADRPAAS